MRIETRLNKKNGGWGDMDDLFLRSLVDLIKTGYCDYQFTVRTLAEAAGICVSYLEEKLHAKHGIYPQKLIETVRISEALKMMAANSKKDFYDISKAVGYKNPKATRLAFKRRLGTTPDCCRRMIESGNEKNLMNKIWDGLEEVHFSYDGNRAHSPRKTSVKKLR